MSLINMKMFTIIELATPVAWKPPPYFTRISSRNTAASCE